MFSKSFLSELRDRLSLVAYVGERVPLKKSGRNFKGQCPFHAEKTPSFMVNDEKQIFHCFGCSEGGDLIRFVMKFDGLSFPEAVRHLAGRAGMTIPHEATTGDTTEEEVRERRRRWCFRLNEIARDFFATELISGGEGGPARNYLKSRGIFPQFWTQPFLGYADKSWDRLVNHLRAKKVPLELAAELGLVRKRDDGGFYDFFRHRVIFPIHAPRGEVLAFGGRTLDENESAKYLNSPDSLIYHKSNCVYGLPHAASAIRKLDQVLVVEGYMDAVQLSQSGIENVVAPLGTALTEGHLRLLTRYTRNVVVVFDGDRAGGEAMMRALPLFIDAKLTPRAVLMPAGEDPDSIIRKEGAESFRARLKKSQTLFEFFIDRVVETSGSDAAGKVQAMQRIIPLLRTVTDPLEQALYRRALADRLHVGEAVVVEALKAPTRGGAAPSVSNKNENEIFVPGAERILIEAMIRHPEIIAQVFKRLQVHDFLDEWCRVIAQLLSERWKENGIRDTGEWLAGIEDPELVRTIRALLVDDEEEEGDLQAMVNDCIEVMSRRPLAARLEKMNADIRRAEVEGNEPELFELLAAKRELVSQLRGTDIALQSE